MSPLPARVAALASAQDGVVSRRQLLALGCTDGDIRVWRGRRLLMTVHDGVHLDHTGPPTWCQRAWAAVLVTAPAVLCGSSALVADGLRRSVDVRADIEVAVEARRRPTPPPGVRVRRVAGLTERARWQLHPPRDRVEEAALDVAAAAADELAAVAVLAEVVTARLTTASRLRDALGRRTRVRRRDVLVAVLDDLAAGACSVLERAYLKDVERAHGLPTGGRQVRDSARGTVYRDVEYTPYGVLVELDGRADHTRFEDRDRDLDRDLDAAASGRVTVRLGWGQVLRRSCRTAGRLAVLLRRGGWTGELRRCPRCRDDVAPPRPGR